ncbi:tetratricopeptide repeat protein [Sphingobium sufflavum]|uniref:tetratricopeptide repeat protein n=1 Tax=Sphingobium sufflavum TaxID=1129547 RepID=UPI001F1E8715|nr:tetratricopeptide repeat protein [Sphingobium sufflavum]MCE7798361.1 tetratricopeptide repeat protein [Sphingobium sufflavum]
MRFTPAALSLAVLLAVTSSASLGQKPIVLNPQSISWSDRGTAAFTSGDLDSATDSYETSLVLDPRNRTAFVGLAQVADAQKLPGKAIRYYDEALSLDPKDVTALRAQGLAMIEKGALESARANLAKIRENCKAPCVAADQLANAIATRGVVPPRIVAASDLKPVPSGAVVKE